MGAAFAMAGTTVESELEIVVVFDNVPRVESLETGWGFAALIRRSGTTVLFDTGADGRVLLSNMERLGLEAAEIDAVVLSHEHHDHTGGLRALLERHGGRTVYAPEPFPRRLVRDAESAGATVVAVGGPQRLLDDMLSTGTLGAAVKEQALIIETGPGLVVVTGCAHPDVADMVERAGSLHDREICLVMGGFHLRGRSEAGIRTVASRLRALGVRKVAPSHCTGDRARRILREEWGADFIDSGLGAVIGIPPEG